MDVDAATQTMINNLPSKTGRSLDEWFATLDAAGIVPHGKAVAHLKTEHGVSHGFANLIVTMHRARDQAPASGEELVDAQYAGPKAVLRPILDRVLEEVARFGDDVDVAPKKTGVSLRRSKQFALVEVPSATRVQLGLNLRGVEPTSRLEASGGMCTHRVNVTTVADIDDEVVGWLREAYERA